MDVTIEALLEMTPKATAHPYDVPASVPAPYACDEEKAWMQHVGVHVSTTQQTTRGTLDRLSAHRLASISHPVDIRRMHRARLLLLRCRGGVPVIAVIFVVTLKALQNHAKAKGSSWEGAQTQTG